MTSHPPTPNRLQRLLSRWSAAPTAAPTTGPNAADALLPGEDETDRLLRVFPVAHVTTHPDEADVHVGLDWDGDAPGESGYVTRSFPTMHAALTYACDQAHVIEVRFGHDEPLALVRNDVSRACWERLHHRRAVLEGIQPTPRWITPAEALRHA